MDEVASCRKISKTTIKYRSMRILQLTATSQSDNCLSFLTNCSKFTISILQHCIDEGPRIDLLWLNVVII